MKEDYRVAPQTHYCYRELKDISESELIHRSNGTIFRPEIHDVDPPHFLNGVTISGGGGTPGVVTAVTFKFDPASAMSFDPEGHSIAIEASPEEEAKPAPEGTQLALRLYELAQSMSDDDLRDVVGYAEEKANQ